MAINFRSEGRRILYSNGATAVDSGALLEIGEFVGVALEDIDAYANGTVAIEGVFTVAKVSGTEVSQGDDLYFDPAGPHVTPTEGTDGLAFAGYAFGDAGEAATTVQLLLRPGIRGAFSGSG